MKKEEAIRRIKEFGLYHAIGDLPNSAKTVEAFNMAIEALKERPTGKWIGVQDYCKHLEEKTGERYAPTGLGKLIYCNQCWQVNNRHSAYCPNCGARMKGGAELCRQKTEK